MSEVWLARGRLAVLVTLVGVIAIAWLFMRSFSTKPLDFFVMGGLALGLSASAFWVIKGWRYFHLWNDAFRKANRWKRAAVLTAMATLLWGGSNLGWIGQAANEQAMLLRVQIVAAGMAVGLGAVTFLTVVWRGMIAAEQAWLQRKQIDKVSEQIAATSDNNVAALLQKGAELIDDLTKPAKVKAGIASLSAVTVTEKNSFAQPAMNLLLDLTAHSWNKPNILSDFSKLSIKAMNIAHAATGITVSDYLSIRGNSTDIRPMIDFIHPAIFAEYQWAEFYYDKILIKNKGKKVYSVKFYQCKFSSCEIDGSNYTYSDCNFEDCKIVGAKENFLKSNKFVFCDFSGCEFFDGIGRFDFRADKNYYVASTPPKLPSAFRDLTVDWEKLLIRKTN